MKMTKLKKILSLFLCCVLIAAIALTTIGCNDTKAPSDAGSSSQSEQSEKIVKGTGSTVFDFAVTDKSGNKTQFEIHTDKETVGAALLELGLIAGEDGAYGLYVKTVNGITVDYDTDGKYWAFYENGNYAMSGVDTTKIVSDTTYEFKVE